MHTLIDYVADYTALRAYKGTQKMVYVTGYLASAAPSGIAGMFEVDDNDTTSSDNGGTVIIDGNNKRRKRVFDGEVIEAEWFGVKFNNSQTDATANRAAFQEAVDWINASYYGGVLWVGGNAAAYVDVVNYVPDGGGVSGITSIKMRDGVNVDGYGTIKLKDGAYGTGAFYRMFSSRDVTRLSNASIRNITVDGNKANQTASVQCSNILLECLDNVAVENVKSINANGQAIQLRGTAASFATNLRIIRNTVKDASNIGIQSSQFNGLLIDGNDVDTTTDNCIDIYGEDATNTCHGKNFRIVNNKCKSGLVGIFHETVMDGVTANNVIESCSFGWTVNRITGEPRGITIHDNRVINCTQGWRVTGDCGGGVTTNGGVRHFDNFYSNFTSYGGRLAEGGNASYVESFHNFYVPTNNTTQVLQAGGGTVSFCKIYDESVYSDGIAAGKLWTVATGSVVGVTVGGFKVFPNQVGIDFFASNADIDGGAIDGTVIGSATAAAATFTRMTVQTGSASNLASGTYAISVTDNTGGILYVTAFQSGVGTSMWAIPYAKRAGSLAIGAADTAILTADPLGGATASAGSVQLTITFSNTDLRFAFHATPTP